MKRAVVRHSKSRYGAPYPHRIPKTKRTNKKSASNSLDPEAMLLRFKNDMKSLNVTLEIASTLPSSSKGVSEPGSSAEIKGRNNPTQASPSIRSRSPGRYIQVESAEPSNSSSTSFTRRQTPNESDLQLASRWQAIIPTLVEEITYYYASTRGHPVNALTEDLQHVCASPRCTQKTGTSILLLYFDHFRTINITHCRCKTICQILVRHGLFPTAPVQPRSAISIDFLDFYSALFERACDAVQAMAMALNSFYGRRGFHLRNKQGEKFREPFRRGLGYAAQWLDVLRMQVDAHVEASLVKAGAQIQAAISSSAARTSQLEVGLDAHDHGVVTPPMTITQPNTPQSSVTNNVPLHQSNSPSSLATQLHEGPPRPPLPPNPKGQCSRVLSQLCPACFGGSKFGLPLINGGDFQLSTDGNYHHRHLLSAGQGVQFYKPRHIVPVEFVNAVGRHLDSVRKRKPKARASRVPDEAINGCQSSFDAADGEKKKTPAAELRYDSQGWMSLVCRHDIPLLFANIDTPGEKQKYPIALILWLQAMVPLEATLTVLYDIGCILHRSIESYDILPPDLLPRIQFATTAMHAYGHQTACQLAYNPRLMKGLGLSDGEGVERIWSRLRKLIALVRSSSSERRNWLTDRLLDAIAHDLRESLGDWIRKRLSKGVKEQGARAQQILSESKVAVHDLRQQWDLEQEVQMLAGNDTPNRLKREINTILSLEHEIAQLEKAIKATKISLAPTSQQSAKVVNDLFTSLGLLRKTVDVLFSSLNVQESFPDVATADLDFVRTLLVGHDLKVKIRNLAVGSFFQCDRLDQATGGRNPALGTRLHQETHNAISKRQPALLSTINKYNLCCKRLRNMKCNSYQIPLPASLPTKLADLRKDPQLWQDVWISTQPRSEPPPWIIDGAVKSGVRAMIQLDRCSEEQLRLVSEVENMCSWFVQEMSNVEVALRDPENFHIKSELLVYRTWLLHMKDCWSSEPGDILPKTRLDSLVERAQRIGHLVWGSEEWISDAATTFGAGDGSSYEFEIQELFGLEGEGENVAEDSQIEEPEIMEILGNMEEIFDETTLDDFGWFLASLGTKEV